MAGLALLTLLAAGCSSSDRGNSSGEGWNGEAAQNQQQEQQKSATKVAGGDVGVTDQTTVLAKARISAGGGDADLVLNGLNARGGLAIADFTLTPVKIRPLNSNTYYWFFNQQKPTASLLDPVNLKRYTVVKDSDGNLLAPDSVALAVGQPVSLSFTFAAPPQDVTRVDVQLGDMPPFRNVPISR
ncbi:hypothetical protein GCM10027589_18770 [Actinocorallia lasiicapitis]